MLYDPLYQEPTYKPLTAREKEILRIMREGVTEEEVAARFRISINTVGNHMQNIFNKLGVHDSHNAVLVDYVMQEYLGES